MRYHYAPIRIAKKKKKKKRVTIPKTYKVAEKLNSLYIASNNKNCTALESSWQFLKKLNIQLPYNSENVLLDIHSREIKIYVHTKSYT